MLVLIAAVTHRGASPAAGSATPVLVWIGVRSYGLYLFHWPIFMIIRGVAGNPLSSASSRSRWPPRSSSPSCRSATSRRRSARWGPAWRDGRGPAGSRSRGRSWWCDRRGDPVRARSRRDVGDAPLQQNEIAEALDDNNEFTTDLLDVDDDRRRPSTATTTSTTRPRPVAPTTTPNRTVPRRPTRRRHRRRRRPHAPTAPVDRPCRRPQPPTTIAAAPPRTGGAAGVVNDMSTMTPLSVPRRRPGTSSSRSATR